MALATSYLYTTVCVTLIQACSAAGLSALFGFWTWGVWVIAFGGVVLVVGGIVLCIVCCAKQQKRSRGVVVGPAVTGTVLQQQSTVVAGYPVVTGYQASMNPAYANTVYPNSGYPNQAYPNQGSKPGYAQPPPAYGSMNPQYVQPPPYGAQTASSTSHPAPGAQATSQPSNTESPKASEDRTIPPLKPAGGDGFTASCTSASTPAPPANLYN